MSQYDQYDIEVEWMDGKKELFPKIANVIVKDGALNLYVMGNVYGFADVWLTSIPLNNVRRYGAVR